MTVGSHLDSRVSISKKITSCLARIREVLKIVLLDTNAFLINKNSELNLQNKKILDIITSGRGHQEFQNFFSLLQRGPRLRDEPAEECSDWFPQILHRGKSRWENVRLPRLWAGHLRDSRQSCTETGELDSRMKPENKISHYNFSTEASFLFL